MTLSWIFLGLCCRFFLRQVGPPLKQRNETWYSDMRHLRQVTVTFLKSRKNSALERADRTRRIRSWGGKTLFWLFSYWIEEFGNITEIWGWRGFWWGSLRNVAFARPSPFIHIGDFGCIKHTSPPAIYLHPTPPAEPDRSIFQKWPCTNALLNSHCAVEFSC